MWDAMQKIKYRVNAGIPEALTKWNLRMEFREQLPFTGIHGEEIYLTNAKELNQMAKNLEVLYKKLPDRRGEKETILLDAWSSATIEGARTTVEKVKKSFKHPTSKDDRMVINTVNGSDFAYRKQITEKNIRQLWEIVIDGVCENESSKGVKYRDGMVYIGSSDRTIHVPAPAEKLDSLMEQYFDFCSSESYHPIIRSFAAHFYFVYIHPFCDGNGRIARILNSSQLYHSGYSKVKQISLATAINRQLGNYYSSLADSEVVLNGQEKPWLDISPFVSYMLEIMEQSLVDAALAVNTLSESEQKVLGRMNKIGIKAEITVKNAAKILKGSESNARVVLQKLVDKGYLTVDTSGKQYVYKLEQHIPNI